MPAILNPAYSHEEKIGQMPFDAHLLAGGEKDSDVEVAIGCLGKNAPESCQLGQLPSSEARRYLQVFRQVRDSSKEYPALRDDLAEKTAELTTSLWRSKHSSWAWETDRPREHMGDAGFRGVFLLLATLLPLDAAAALRERLVDYAADTKDHTISDTFVQLLRVRKAA